MSIQDWLDDREEEIAEGHYGSEAEDGEAARHGIYDHDGLSWAGYSNRRGTTEVACKCGHQELVSFEWDGQDTVTVDGFTHLDADVLSEHILGEIESAWEAQEERRAYEGPSDGPGHGRPYGSIVR